MCGISGCYYSNSAAGDLRPLIEKMTDLITHRGPDGHGYFVEDEIALGHRRLSIIDLSLGAQPMSNREKTVWIVFNGEIYNFREIRKEFENENYPFQTHSDTEVLIALYEKYGVDLLEKINGMFVFAIWDVKRRQLFIARDRLGKKPLFYHMSAEKFIFASEMKSILADPSVPREVSPESVEMFFTFGFVPAPYTILKDVQKLLPGHYMLVSADQKIIRKYWDVEFCPISPNGRMERYKDELYDLLYQAVKRRLISDVPLGAFLSGGVDSSSVVGMMSIVNELPVKTFTIGFEESEYSEADDARLVAEHFKTTHEELFVRPSSFEILPDIVWHFDEPFGDSSAIPTFFVSKMARQFVTVVLSGDGGDEMFAGYTRYQRIDQLRRFKRFPRWLKRYALAPLAEVAPLNFPAKNMLMDIASDNAGPFGLGIYPYIKGIVFSDMLKKQLNGFELNYQSFPHLEKVDHLNALSRHQYLDIKLYLPDDILTKVDKMSMANSLETRAPLLDYTIAEFAAKLPAEWQIVDGEGKAFLKDVVRRYLPSNVFTKPKHGFSIPKNTWFKGDLKAFAGEVLLSRRARERGYFNSDVIEKVLRVHAEGNRDYSKWIWCLLNFEIWHRLFIDADTRKV